MVSLLGLGVIRRGYQAQFAGILSRVTALVVHLQLQRTVDFGIFAEFASSDFSMECFKLFQGFFLSFCGVWYAR